MIDIKIHSRYIVWQRRKVINFSHRQRVQNEPQARTTFPLRLKLLSRTNHTHNYFPRHYFLRSQIHNKGNAGNYSTNRLYYRYENSLIKNKKSIARHASWL